MPIFCYINSNKRKCNITNELVKMIAISYNMTNNLFHELILLSYYLI